MADLTYDTSPDDLPDRPDNADQPDVAIDVYTPTSKNERLLPTALYEKHTRRVHVTEITLPMLEMFLDEYTRTGLWAMSCNHVGISPTVLERIRKRDEGFAAVCAKAKEDWIESVEAECHRRAIEGWDEPVFSHKTGANIGSIRRHDGRLLELVLKRHRKEYKEGFEAPTANGVAIMVVPMMATSEAQMMDMARQAAIEARAETARAALPPGQDAIVEQGTTPNIPELPT